MSGDVALENYQQSSSCNTQLSDETIITLSSKSQAIKISSQETLDSFEHVEKDW